MKSVSIEYTTNSKLKSFVLHHKLQDSTSLLIQVFCGVNDAKHISELLTHLCKLLPEAKVIGSTTDGEIIDGKVVSAKTVISFTNFKHTTLKTFLIRHKDNGYLSGQSIAKALVEDDTKLLIVFADGIVTNGDALLEGIDSINKKVIVAGGLAGDNGEFLKTHVFTQDGIIENGAVAVSLNSSKLRVRNHYNFNWKSIGKELTITKSKMNRVYTIDGKKAVDAYAHYFGKDLAKELPMSGAEFPLILKRGSLKLARTVIAKKYDGSLVFAGNINEGEKVRFGYGDGKDILKQSLKTFSDLQKESSDAIFVYSCMARKRSVSEYSDAEILLLQQLSSVSGFFTYGEFFTSRRKKNHLFNETMTLVALNENNRVPKSMKKVSVKVNENSSRSVNALAHLINVTNTEMQEQTDAYETLFERSFDGLFSMENGKVVECNNTLVEMFGYKSKEELLGLVISEIFPEYQLDGSLSLEKFKRVLEVAKENGKNQTDWVYKRKSGENFYSNIVLTPMSLDNKDVLHGVVRDVSQKRKVDETLKKTQNINRKLKERIELTLLGNNDGIWDWNLTDDSVYFSSRWKEILGFSEEELANDFNSWESRIHPDDLVEVMSNIQDNIDGKTEYFQNIHRLKHKDGHWVWVLDRGKGLFDEQGNITHMVGTHTDISEDKEIQLKLAHQAQIIDQIHDGVVSISFEGVITSWNAGAHLLVGYKAHEIMGQHITMIYLEEDYKLLRKTLKKLLKKEEVHTEVRLIKKSNEIIYADLILSLLKDENGSPIEVIGYFRDITNRKQIEDKLSEQHNYLQSIINGVDDPIMVIKDDYSVELMNSTMYEQTAQKVFSYNDHPKCYEIASCVACPNCEDLFLCPLEQVMKTQKHMSVVHEKVDENLNKQYIELSATPLFDKHQKCIGIIESSRDITAHLAVQDELREQKNILNEQLYEQIIKLREKDELLMEQANFAQLGEMMNMVAHQWRQPLNAISATAIELSLLNDFDELDTAKLESSSDFIQNKTQEMSAVINDFMNFNKRSEDSKFLLYEAVESAIKIIRPQFENINISIDVDIDKTIKIFHNKKSIDHALINILINARDAFSESKKSKKKVIKIHSKKLKNGASLSIEDNAGGVPKAIIKKIFNPYFTTKEQGKGTGIGLYMVKKIVEKIPGSKVRIDVVDKHSTFTLTFRETGD